MHYRKSRIALKKLALTKHLDGDGIEVITADVEQCVKVKQLI